jgi:hypothetical protein
MSWTVPRNAIADILQRYGPFRAGGVHDGPPLVAMRLYEVEVDD